MNLAFCVLNYGNLSILFFSLIWSIRLEEMFIIANVIIVKLLKLSLLLLILFGSIWKKEYKRMLQMKVTSNGTNATSE